jgi:precorrin-6B methylase 2
MKATRPGGDALLALARDFMEARIFLTAAELDLFTLLARKSLSAAEVTAQLRGDARAVAILLDALAAMGLLRKSRQRYRCAPVLAPLLASDSPDSLRPMVLHSASLWERWTELTGLVRGDEAARARAYAPRGVDRMRAFIGAMHVVARGRAPEIVRQIKPGRARALLDIGGASGTFLMEFLRVVPQMRATLFDLAGPIELARERLGAAGLLERVTLASGDFYVDELPGGHDLALLSAIIHQNSSAQNVELYRKAWRALVPGGRLVIRDHVISPERTVPRGGAIFAVNMLCGTHGGNVYTFKEIRGDLVAAGFVRARWLQKGDDRMNGLVEAFRPR